MGNDTGPSGGSKLRIADIALIVVFALGILAWGLALDPIAVVLHEWTIYPQAGDAGVGMLVLGADVLVGSLLFLAASIPLSFVAKGLPKWFRGLTVASPALGCLVALAVFYRALGG